jgi:hypothetical protein
VRPAELTPEQAETKQRWLALLGDRSIGAPPTGSYLPCERHQASPSDCQVTILDFVLCAAGAIVAGVAIYLATVVVFSL